MCVKFTINKVCKRVTSRRWRWKEWKAPDDAWSIQKKWEKSKKKATHFNSFWHWILTNLADFWQCLLIVKFNLSGREGCICLFVVGMSLHAICLVIVSWYKICASVVRYNYTNKFSCLPLLSQLTEKMYKFESNQWKCK